MLSAVITEEHFALERWASVFPTDCFKSDVVSTLSNSCVLVKGFWKAVNDIASTRECNALDNFSELSVADTISFVTAPHTKRGFDYKRERLLAVEKSLLKITTGSTHDLRWWRGGSLSGVMFTLRSLSHSLQFIRSPVRTKQKPVLSPFLMKKIRFFFATLQVPPYIKRLLAST